MNSVTQDYLCKRRMYAYTVSNQNRVILADVTRKINTAAHLKINTAAHLKITFPRFPCS